MSRNSALLRWGALGSIGQRNTTICGSFWQVAAYMAFSTGVPAGHGHRYGSNVAAGWAAIVPPDGWTEDDTDDLRDLIDWRADVRDRQREAAG
jgi:uncharacterized membrane protein